MSFPSNRSLLFVRSRGTSPAKRLSNRRPRLESLESRTVLSTVSGVSAADAAVAGQSADDESPILAGGPGTDESVHNAAGAIADCPSSETNHNDWSQALLAEQSAKETLEGLEKKLAELEQKLKDLEKERRAWGHKFQEAEDKLAQSNPRIYGKEREAEEAKSKEAREKLNEVEGDIKKTKDEIDTTKLEIEKLKKELGQDQDADALSDNPPAPDASGVNIDCPLDLVPPFDLGDGGTGHLEMFLAPADWDVLAAANASQGLASDTYDLSSLDNDTGAIDFVRWGAVDVPSHTNVGNIDLDDFESRSSLSLGPRP
jgi:hypothetical protein